MRKLLWCVLLFGASSSLIAQESNAIMPLKDVKPGMKGYGYSVFSGSEPERFEFIVRSIVPNMGSWPNVITVQLSGGPIGTDGKPIFANSQIFSGMSGSPMYVDGKLIGGLAMAPDFATTAKALVTPIEYQLAMKAMRHETGAATATVHPGQYIAVCFVYGDTSRCVNSTVTANIDGHVFTTSHSVGLPAAKIDLPTFLVPVADLLETQSGATKLTGELGKPVGTAVIHGAFGFVVVEGLLPRSVTVKLTAEGQKPEDTVKRTYFMAYHKSATANLKDALQTEISRLPIDVKESLLDICIKIKQPVGEVHLRDTTSAALESMEKILDKLIDEEGDKLDIEGIDTTFQVLAVDDLWHPISINLKGKDNKGVMTIVARRERDKELSEISSVVDTTFLKGLDKKNMKWYDGAGISELLLKKMPIRSAFGLLDQIKNREGIYLIWEEPDKNLKPLQQDASGAWHRRESGLRILITLPSDSRFYMTDRDGMELEPKK